MTIPRMIGLLIALTVIGITVVIARVDQARHVREIQELQFQQTELRQRNFRQSMELGRLRSPQKIRERAERLGLMGDSDGSKDSPGSKKR